MPQTFVIDQAATFTGVGFLQSSPKMAFQSDQQDALPDGRLKWEVQVVAGFRDNFGNSTHEIIKVNVASATNPGDGLAQYTPVHLINFVVGVIPAEMGTDRNGGQKIKGGSVWYRADEIRSTAVPSGSRKTNATTE